MLLKSFAIWNLRPRNILLNMRIATPVTVSGGAQREWPNARLPKLLQALSWQSFDLVENLSNTICQQHLRFRAREFRTAIARLSQTSGRANELLDQTTA